MFLFGAGIMMHDNLKDHELHRGVEYLTRHLTPAPGSIPRVPGIDVYGVSVPFNGIAGGDLITYLDFQERFDLDARIRRAVLHGQDGIMRNLQRLARTGGILVADASGHEFKDALRVSMLHQAFHTGALYEMDLNGEITTRLFEQINTRFLKSVTLRNLNSDQESTSFITLIYGEISNTGRFRFISAGHPPPLIFSREYHCFVEICQDRLISCAPIGLQPGEDYADAGHFDRTLGYKKHYTINELNLMGQGDILLLYTDGLFDSFSAFTRNHLERIVSHAMDRSAQEIGGAIMEAVYGYSALSDDLSLVVVKRD